MRTASALPVGLTLAFATACSSSAPAGPVADASAGGQPDAYQEAADGSSPQPDAGPLDGANGEGGGGGDGGDAAPPPQPGTHFASQPTGWPVPALTNQNGAWNVAGQAFDPSSTGNWVTLDLDGDALPDLIVTAQADASGSSDQVLGLGSSPHWNVYKNMGSGFASQPTAWPVPALTNQNGAWNLAGQAFDPSSTGNWVTLDLDGDALPDLIVTAQADASGSSDQVLGLGSSPHWNVYKNTGSGFASQPTGWPVPAFTNQNGAWNVAGQAFDPSSTGNWVTEDLDGDALPDLIVTAKTDAGGSSDQVLGLGSSPHWDVYKNTGSGFAAQPTTWPVPALTNRNGAWNVSGQAFDPSSTGNWVTEDVDGDRLPDLIVTAKTDASGSSDQVLGLGSSPHWDVYKNTGSGFAAQPTTWSVPAFTNQNGAWNVSGQAFDPSSTGTWVTVDLDSDGLPDLIVTAKADASGSSDQVLGLGSSPHWELYRNTGAGFALQPVAWPVPALTNQNGAWNVAGQAFDPSSTGNWVTFALTNGRVDLVVTADANASGTADQVLGLGSSPHWNVYLNLP